MSLIQRRSELDFSDAEVDDFLEQASFKSFEISELIEKLIRYCSVVKDIQHERFETFNLNQIIDEVIERYERKFKSIRPSYKIEVKDIPKNTVIAFPHEYGSLVFENLIDNAIKFNSGDDVVVEISATSEKDGLVTCTISDNGPGIPSEFLESILASYYQIEKHFSGAVEGVGLGLTLVKHILGVYHQKIKVTSKVTMGTQVHFTLPVKRK